MSILKLPFWVIPENFAARFDLESATPIEMTGKLHAKINELIESYNKWVQEVNKSIEEYEAANDKDYNCFTQTIVKLTSDYIGMVDLKIIQHDRKFEEYYKSFTSEIIKTTEKIISDLKANGELDAAILEAVDKLETKFGTFKTEINAAVNDLKAENNLFKSQIAEQQTAFFEAANSTKQNLETDYNETKAALDSDYQSTKAALDSDYQSTKAALENDKQDFVNEAQKNFYPYYRFCRFKCNCLDDDTLANDYANIDFVYFVKNKNNIFTTDFDVICEQAYNYSSGWIPARGFYTEYDGEDNKKHEVIAIQISKSNSVYTLTAISRDLRQENINMPMSRVIATSESSGFANGLFLFSDELIERG